jgi:transcription elongation GreA/GreB family factor
MKLKPGDKIKLYIKVYDNTESVEWYTIVKSLEFAATENVITSNSAVGKFLLTNDIKEGLTFSISKNQYKILEIQPG